MTNLTRVADNPEKVAEKKNGRPGSSIGVLSAVALLIAATALGLHFTPDIQRGVGVIARYLPVSGGGPSAGMTRQTQPSLDGAVSEAELMKMARQIENLEGELLVLRGKTLNEIKRLNEAVALLAEPGKLPLIAARIALRHASNSLEQRDIETLATLAGSHPSLVEPVSQLKALALEDVPTVEALRDMFRKQQDPAQEAAKLARMNWWEVPVAYARAGLSDIGISHAASVDQDQSVMERITRELDMGRLDKALLEMQSASHELQTELSAWESVARLRLTLDHAILLVVDGLLEQISLSKPNASPG